MGIRERKPDIDRAIGNVVDPAPVGAGSSGGGGVGIGNRALARALAEALGPREVHDVNQQGYRGHADADDVQRKTERAMRKIALGMRGR